MAVTAIIIADHSRLAPLLPLPNLTTTNAHLAELLVYLGIGFLWCCPWLARVVKAEGTSHGSLFTAFKSTHPILKLSFSVSLLLLMFLGLEGISYLCIRFTSQPTLKERISGYRVFKESPLYKEWFPIGADPGEISVVDSFGFICDHPVSFEKPPGTLRVFLTGGSAMAGAGQTEGLGYENVHPYPKGTYVYRKSIAGALRDALQAANPGLRVEVVNAAHNQKCLHQSLIHYLEAISRFDPDYLVSMDGFNDLYAFHLGDIWSFWEGTYLRPFIDLDDQERGAMTGSWMRLLADRTFTRLRQKRTSPQPRTGDPKPARSEEQIRKEYAGYRPMFVECADRWLQTFRHYAAVVREDDVGFVFALQPMVSRSGNKKLSAIEKQFDDIAVPRASEPATCNISMLRYFFDEYLSAEVQRLTEKKGGFYCDIAKSMGALDERLEFYTDYCHLTPEGNRIVANLFAEKIQADLPARLARGPKTHR